jgi:hypothetical protein
VLRCCSRSDCDDLPFKVVRSNGTDEILARAVTPVTPYCSPIPVVTCHLRAGRPSCGGHHDRPTLGAGLRGVVGGTARA